MEEPALYNLAAAAGSFAEAAQHLRKLNPSDELLGDEKIRSVEQMFHWLRGGMVPMRGRITSHVRVTIDDKSYFAPRDLIEPLFGAKATTKDVDVAGYCTLNGFWQEPSRIFPDGQTFRCMIRVEDPNPERAWDELDHLSIFEPFGADIRGGARRTLQLIRKKSGRPEAAPAPITFGQILETHAVTVATAASAGLNEAALAAVLAQQWATMDPAVVPPLIRRRMQVEIESAYVLPTGLAIDDLRVASYAQHGRLWNGQPAVNGAAQQATGDTESPVAMRVQFIGIYW